MKSPHNAKSELVVVLSAVLAASALCNVRLAHAEGIWLSWEKYQFQVEPIEKIYPADTDHLHYDRTESGESMNFRIDTSKCHDKDRRKKIDECGNVLEIQITDFGIDWSETDWSVNDSFGTLTGDGSATATYTAGSQIKTQVTVYAQVRDHVDVGAYPESTRRSYGNIKVYKVGVHCTGPGIEEQGGYTYYEDPEVEVEKLWTAYANMDKLVFSAATTLTGTANATGQGSWELHCGWTVVTLPLGCTIHGKINFSPQIKARGTIEGVGWGVGSGMGGGWKLIFEILGNLGELATDKTITLSYAFVAVKALGQLLGQGSMVSIGVGYDSMISYIERRKNGGWKTEWGAGVTPTLQSNPHLLGWFSTSVVSLSPAISWKPQWPVHSFHGSLSLVAKALLLDTSAVMYHGVEVKKMGTTPAHLKWGCTKPVYQGGS